MKHSKIPVAQSIVSLCLSKHIDHVVISPGSRNAPLTIEFTKNEAITAYSIVDERCAAFFALGIAQQLLRPVALVCTSGSALLNYYPAIAEAFYSDIPLVVISADRPIERIDIGDGQTIRQKDVFENHCLYSANLYSEVVPSEVVQDVKLNQKIQESRRHNEQEINKALNTAIEANGPVHINVPFYEPLYAMTNTTEESPILIAPKYFSNTYSNKELSRYAAIWNESKKKIVLVGVLPPNSIAQSLLDKLAEDPSVLIFTETTSNLDHPDLFTRIDNIIGPCDSEDFEKLRPEVLLTFGGMVISKKIKAFLRTYQPAHHWHVDPKKAYDTYFCLNRHFETTANAFLNQFLPLVTIPKSEYKDYWLSIRALRNNKHQEYLKAMPWCDFKAFSHIIDDLESPLQLQLGNSSTVRYVQLFDLPKELAVYCNRGTSGIDGSTSTAIGSAVKSNQPTLLITGDLSFFYDSNALWNSYTPKDFKIIVINNSGGGIFRILPNRDKNTPQFDTYFETIHDLTARQLCEMFKVQYYQATDENEYVLNKDKFFNHSKGPALLEIFTPRLINDEILLNYFDFIK